MKTRKLFTFALLATLTSLVHSTPFLIINEVYYDEVGSDGAGTFTELYGEPGLDLQNWSLLGINGSNGNPYTSFDLSGLVPESGLFLLPGTDWQNGPDAIHLIFHDMLGNIDILVDALQYGNISGHNFGEGNHAEDVGAGFSLSRKFAGWDTNDNAADFIAMTQPTPGVAAPEYSVPEPGSLALLLLGLTGLFCQRNKYNKIPPSTSRYMT